MKTNQIMTRKMSQFDVLQRTSDGMFNASALLRQWNKERGNADLRVSKFLDQHQTKSFISALKDELSVGANQPIIDNQVVTILKSKDNVGRMTIKDYWMHPYLFIKFAMWLNPRFEVKVIKFVYDELIKCRHIVGDGYPKLTSSIARFPDADYPKVARAMNYVVFNHHENNIRNSATIEQLRELDSLQDKIATMVDLGFITSCNGIIEVLRKMYAQKHEVF